MTSRGDRTRAKLIKATLSVVAEVGYAKTSTRAIAAKAKVAEGTLYRHFPDKMSLFFAAALEPSEAVLEWVEGLPTKAGKRTVEENLVDALFKLSSLQERVLPLEIAIQNDPELAAHRRSVVASSSSAPAGPPEALVAYLEAEQALGRVNSLVRPRAAAVTLLAALFGVGMMSAAHGAPIQRADIVEVVKLFVHGAAPRKGA
jgi:AcrR family transcriptional regulator